MIKFDYLDLLYKWKVEAEQELEKLEEQYNPELPLPMDEADHIREIRKINLENAKGLIGRYTTAIRSYISNHTN